VRLSRHKGDDEGGDCCPEIAGRIVYPESLSPALADDEATEDKGLCCVGIPADALVIVELVNAGEDREPSGAPTAWMILRGGCVPQLSVPLRRGFPLRAQAEPCA
jgi:hypothetical protein